jgi:hypothetical protein
VRQDFGLQQSFLINDFRGRQLLDTPFARHDFYTMLPRAMNGASLTIRPLPWDKIKEAD